MINTLGNVIFGMHGLGAKRLFTLYGAINSNLNKLARVINGTMG